ncbi:hypothetical protein BC628DRAFT_1355612 [Trametes gibbosa]|nr:hypothetical protein BC628DRAFT_1355612 [Trametes gibbosa]
MAELASPRLIPSHRPRELADAAPPLKRMKIIHPSTQPVPGALSDVSTVNPLLHAPPPCLLSGVDQSEPDSRRPLTRCHPANEVCELREHDAPAPEPTLLSRTASHQLLPKLPQRAAKSAVVSRVPCAHATPGDGRYISSPDPFASSPSTSLSLPHPPSAPMSYNFASTARPSASRSTPSPVSDSFSPLVAAGMSFEADVLNYLYEGLDQTYYCDFPEDSLSAFEFSFGDGLAEEQVGMSPPNAQSPIFRSMSRSSFGSSSNYTGSSSPGDYPTPASDSDSSVTTPAPTEPVFGWLPDLQSLYAHHPPVFAPDAKCKEPSYVQALSGSAPLFSYGSPAYPSPSTTLPPSVDDGLAGARRHSEPANLAALHFPLFFQGQPSQIAPAPPDATATRPITDNFACSPSPAAGPSSIAPHQTQLPRQLEILQPKPVRAYKPPILRGDAQYDPKDFVRRHSEPILPLRELDVFSHLPLDVTEESPEEDETMMFERSEDDLYDDENSSDDDTLMDEYSFEGVDVDANLGGESFFDPHWSWFQPLAVHSAAATAPQLSWRSADMLNPDIEWTATFAFPSTSSGSRR